MKKINKQTVLIGFVSFFMSFSSSVVISCAVDFSKHLGLAASVVVMSRMIGEGAGYIGRFVIGLISDIIGNRRKFLLIGYGSIIFIKPLFIISCFHSIPLLYRVILYTSANISEKFFGSLRDPIRDAWLADYTKVEDLSINLAFRRFLSYAGSITGALFSFFLSNKLSYQNLFLFAIIPSFIGVFLLYKNIHDEPDLKKVEKTSINKSLFSNFISDIKKTNQFQYTIFLLIGIALLFIGKINEFSLWFTADSLGFKENNAILFIIYYLSSSIGSILLSYLLGRISTYKILIFKSLTIAFINYLILSNFSYSLMIIATVFYGMYSAFLEILSTYMTLKFYHNTQWKATIISILNFIIGVSYSLSGILNKYLIEKYGLLFQFKISIILIILGSFIILFNSNRKIQN